MSQPTSFRRRLASNTLASMATNVWTIVLTLASLPVVLRGLGAEAFGVWVFVQTFSATNGWLSVSATGLATSSSRHVASTLSLADPERLRRATGATFAVFVLAGVLFGGALAILIPTLLDRALDLSGVDLSSLELLGLAVGVQVLAEHVSLAATSALEGMQRVALARLIDAVRRTASVAAVAVIASTGGGLLGVAVASAAATFAVTAVALALLWRSRQLPMGAPTRRGMRSVVTYAGTVSALTGTGVLHRTMDRTIAGIAFGPSAVALVEIANQIQVGATALLSSSTYPVLSSAAWLDGRADRGGLRSLFERSTRYSVLLTLPLCAIVIALAGPFLRTWVGSDFSDAIGLTQVAVVYVVLAAPLQAGSNLLQGVGQAGMVLRASLTSVLVNLVTSLILVQSVGLVGVFLGTIAGTITLFPMLAGSISQCLGQDSVRTIGAATTSALVPGILAAGCAGAVTRFGWPDPATLAAGGVLGSGVALVVALTWSIGADERDELMSALRRQTP